MKVFGENLLVYKTVHDGYFNLDKEKATIWFCFSNTLNTFTDPSRWEDGYLVRKEGYIVFSSP